VIDAGTLLAGMSAVGAALAWAEKRYRDMRQTMIQIETNQRWIAQHVDGLEGLSEPVADGGTSDDD